MSGATPRPCKLPLTFAPLPGSRRGGDGFQVFDADHFEVALLGAHGISGDHQFLRKEYADLAALIVRAVNSHDALVAIKDEAELMLATYDANMLPTREDWNRLRAALALAKAKSP